MAVIFLLIVPRFVFSQEVIRGEKWNAFIASSAGYMNRSVILEDTFRNIDDNFNSVEASNNLTGGRYVTFKVDTGRKTIACLIPFSAEVLQQFKEMPSGTRIQVYGRIRMKNTPKGVLIGFIADKVDALGS